MGAYNSHYGQIKEKEQVCGEIGCTKAAASEQTTRSKGQAEKSRTGKEDRAPRAKVQFARYRVARSGAAGI